MHGSTNQIEFRAKIDAFNEAVKRMSKDTSQLDALRDKHQKVCPEPQTLKTLNPHSYLSTTLSETSIRRHDLNPKP